MKREAFETTDLNKKKKKIGFIYIILLYIIINKYCIINKYFSKPPSLGPGATIEVAPPEKG